MDQYSLLREHHAFLDAPFTAYLGVFWTEKKIIAVFGEENPSSIIHEMGHVFASLTEPPKSDEYDFLGWEYAVARYVKLPISDWLHSNGDYQIPSGWTIDDLIDRSKPAYRDNRPPTLRKVILGRLKVARDKGLVVGNIPQAIR
jgi:hypothetical protein